MISAADGARPSRPNSRQAFSMSPTIRTIFFAAMGFVSLWSLMKDLGAGTPPTAA
jgi:hypothetical protein